MKLTKAQKHLRDAVLKLCPNAEIFSPKGWNSQQVRARRREVNKFISLLETAHKKAANSHAGPFAGLCSA